MHILGVALNHSRAEVSEGVAGEVVNCSIRRARGSAYTNIHIHSRHTNTCKQSALIVPNKIFQPRPHIGKSVPALVRGGGGDPYY